MSVSGVSTTASSTSSSDSRTSLAGNMELFLSMLITQLQNQDPTDPMDTNEFTSQLVQFASVEQQIAMNENLEALINLQQNNQLSMAVSYVGKTVKAETRAIAVQDGEANYSYIVPQNAAEVTIVIADMNGNIVRTETVSNMAAGEYQRSWDGCDDDGNQLEDGAYQIVVAGVNSDGDTFECATALIGVVTGVSNTGDEPTLIISGIEIPLDLVVSVYDKLSSATG